MARIFWSEKNFWSDEAHVERLKQLWADGFSCSEISRSFGGAVTRNAVIGKVSRLGLSGRATATRTIARRENVRPRRSVIDLIMKEPPAPVVEEEPVILADGNHVTILTVTDRMCRWPIGDPAASDFHFCGRSPRSGSPYCEAHARRAYAPAATAASNKKAQAVEAAMSAAQDRTMRRMGLG